MWLLRIPMACSLRPRSRLCRSLAFCILSRDCRPPSLSLACRLYDGATSDETFLVTVQSYFESFLLQYSSEVRTSEACRWRRRPRQRLQRRWRQQQRRRQRRRQGSRRRQLWLPEDFASQRETFRFCGCWCWCCCCCRLLLLLLGGGWWRVAGCSLATRCSPAAAAAAAGCSLASR